MGNIAQVICRVCNIRSATPARVKRKHYICAHCFKRTPAAIKYKNSAKGKLAEHRKYTKRMQTSAGKFGHKQRNRRYMSRPEVRQYVTLRELSRVRALRIQENAL